jgi:putative SOS response-associated peptidase YedK
MCGRYGFVPGKNLYKRFKIGASGQGQGARGTKEALVLKASYNVAPGRLMPVIIRQSPNQLVEMKWGLVPHWAEDPKIGYKMINARAETLESRPAFRTLLHSKRCLVPANGFYEWKHKGNAKTPYYIKLLNEEYFSMAGLYDVWKDKDGKELMSYTIITTDSNPMLSKIHDRMPVILNRIGEDKWLGSEREKGQGERDKVKGEGIDELLSLLVPYPADEMQAYQVSSLVNSPKNDSEKLIEAIK